MGDFVKIPSTLLEPLIPLSVLSLDSDEPGNVGQLVGPSGVLACKLMILVVWR
jgi:hypothetical protein